MKQDNIPLQNFYYSVVDSSGTLILSDQFVDEQQIISIAGSLAGVYFISMVDERGNKKTQKIILKDQ